MRTHKIDGQIVYCKAKVSSTWNSITNSVDKIGFCKCLNLFISWNFNILTFNSPVNKLEKKYFSSRSSTTAVVTSLLRQLFLEYYEYHANVQSFSLRKEKTFNMSRKPSYEFFCFKSKIQFTFQDKVGQDKMVNLQRKIGNALVKHLNI